MWRIAFLIVVLPLPRVALAVPPPPTPWEWNTVERFHLEPQKAYSAAPGGDAPFVKGVEGQDWYGWWNDGKEREIHFRADGFGRVDFPILDWKDVARRNGDGRRISVRDLEDAILPVFGRLYRYNYYQGLFRLIKTKDYPAGLDIEKDSMVAPLRREGTGKLSIGPFSRRISIRIEKIESGDKGRIAAGTAVIRKYNEKGSTSRTVPLELREGEVRTIDHWTFTVRRIVPKNSKGTKAVGWVELGVESKR